MKNILFFLLIVLCVVANKATYILNSVSDEVKAGEFIYYNFVHEGPIILNLHSTSGDADLYIAQAPTTPTYEPDTYSLHSATCGVDSISIPTNLKRPLIIGVYGHTSHELSTYTLVALFNDNEDVLSQDFDYSIIDPAGGTSNTEESESDSRYNSGSGQGRHSGQHKRAARDRYRQSKPEEESSLWALIWPLIEILVEDGLVVAAKGLSLDTVLLSLFKVWCDPGNLVFVLGSQSQEEEFYITQLQAQGITPLPLIINNESNSTEREKLYLQGGVMFMSARILVVDLLKNRVPTENVTGMVICRAHNILESCQEAFAVRLYRQKNKTGFVKAFSNSAPSFTVGFAHVQRIMKTLFVKNLYLWPRFHATVKSSLNKKKVTVIELHLPLTQSVQRIQSSVLDLINFCIKELKRVNPTLDTEELTVENAISKSFHKLLQYQLDPIWNQLSTKTRQLVADMKTLRHVLRSLTQYDCITFNLLISSLRCTEYARRTSGWVLVDAAEDLFVQSRTRVCGSMKAPINNEEVDPEPCPKWAALSEVLLEIHGKLNDRKCKVEEGDNQVLVLVEEGRTCAQLKRYLTLGSKEMLRRYFFQTMRTNRSPAVLSQFGQVRSGVAPAAPEFEMDEDDFGDFDQQSFSMNALAGNSNGGGQDPDDDEGTDCFRLTMSQRAPENDGVLEATCIEDKSSQGEISASGEAMRTPVITLQPFKKGGDPLALWKTLREIQPRFVVMYDTDMGVVRQLEVYQSTNLSVDLLVYFLVYGGSVEEQAYLTSLRKEKQAFEYLIKEKATMVVPTDQDGKSEDCQELNRDMGKSAAGAAAVPNTRKGGNPKEPTTTPLVVVDIREFRSELPGLIHRRGIEIEPITLTVGDYILTPEICVERKSISDLIGSLNSGRLYNQATSMCRHYTKPMLLIEFDHNKPFALQGKYYLSNDISSNDISSKLILLTLHFPRLKLVWSPSPYATAQLFEELKEGRAQPIAAQAALIGAEVASEEEGHPDKYNSAIHDLVAKLPGVNTKNIFPILNQGQSLDHLLTLSKEQLLPLALNSGDAELLHSALHSVHKPAEDGSGQATGRGGRGKGRWRGRSFLNKKRP